MRDVNFYLALVFGLMVGAGVAYAAEPAETEKLQSDDLPVAETPLRPNLQNEFMSKPITAKKLYRGAWNKDNRREMSAIEQLEYFQKNGPKLDEDLEIIMKNGLILMKKRSYGMKGKDLAKNAEVIQNNPARAIQTLSENGKTEVSITELAALSAETGEASKRLQEKIKKGDTFRKTSYPIDVDSF